MTLACGDSHTSTHGAFGTLAFGIGTSQVRDVLATQTLAMDKLKVRRININGELGTGVYPKDVILYVIRRLGVAGGKGFAYEYGGAVIDKMNMEERMTVCNMSIEGGALVGYVNPDQMTFDYLKGRPHVPKGDAFGLAVGYWNSVASDADAKYDDLVHYQGKEIEPTVTWGINPGQSVGVSEKLPKPEEFADPDGAKKAYEHMGWQPGAPMLGTPINVAFIGSCTNGRLADLRAAAKIAKGRKVNPAVRALVVPGSTEVKKLAEQEGLHEIFQAAGFQWREAGCSMCLAMNPDKLNGREICASSSNRNFIGRQGSPQGRTMLMSPAMVAAAALNVKAIVGESFAAIFAGNCTMMGLPAVVVAAKDIEQLMKSVEDFPQTEYSVDLENKTISYGSQKIAIDLPETYRTALMKGFWDSTALLRSNLEQVKRTAAKLPYMTGFTS